MCGSCSKGRHLLPSQSKKPLRVCDPCAEIVTGKRASVQPTANDSSGDSSDDEEENPSWNSAPPQFYHGNNKN